MLILELRKNEHQDEKKYHNAGQKQAHGWIALGFPAQGVAGLEKPGPDKDAKNQP